MKQHFRGVTSIKGRTWAIIVVLALITSILISVFTFQRAHALPLSVDSLLHDTTQSLEHLLTNEDKSPPPKANNNSSTNKGSTPSPNAAPQSTAPVSPNATTKPNSTHSAPVAPVSEPSAAPLETLPAIDSGELPQSQPAEQPAFMPSFATLPTANITTPTDTVINASDTPFQATQRGWQVFGVMWYWWAITLLVTGLAGYTSTQIVTRRKSLRKAVAE